MDELDATLKNVGCKKDLFQLECKTRYFRFLIMWLPKQSMSNTS